MYTVKVRFHRTLRVTLRPIYSNRPHWLVSGNSYDRLIKFLSFAIHTATMTSILLNISVISVVAAILCAIYLQYV